MITSQESQERSGFPDGIPDMSHAKRNAETPGSRRKNAETRWRNVDTRQRNVATRLPAIVLSIHAHTYSEETLIASVIRPGLEFFASLLACSVPLAVKFPVVYLSRVKVLICLCFCCITDFFA